MSREKWVPSNLRVKRLSDGRIFSCSIGAAKHYGLEIAHQIEWCCEKYLQAVEGSAWEWVFEPAPQPDFGDYADLKTRIDKMAASMQIEGYKPQSSWNQVKAFDIGRRIKVSVPEVNRFLEVYAKTEFASEFVEAMTVFNVLKKWAESNSETVNISTPGAFGKHLRAWEVLYRKSVGLVLGYVTPSYWKRLALKIDPSLQEPDFSVLSEMPEYKEEQPYLSTKLPIKSGRHGFPVFCKNTGITYPSLREAERITLVRDYDIVYCCEGDVPSIDLLGTKYEFSYGKWENVDETWFFGDPKWSVRAYPRKVIDLNTFAEYESIAAASKETGVSAKAVKKLCSQEVIPEEGVPIRTASGIEYYKFRYLEKENAE